MYYIEGPTIEISLRSTVVLELRAWQAIESILNSKLCFPLMSLLINGCLNVFSNSPLQKVLSCQLIFCCSCWGIPRTPLLFKYYLNLFLNSLYLPIQYFLATSVTVIILGGASTLLSIGLLMQFSWGIPQTVQM